MDEITEIKEYMKYIEEKVAEIIDEVASNTSSVSELTNELADLKARVDKLECKRKTCRSDNELKAVAEAISEFLDYWDEIGGTPEGRTVDEVFGMLQMWQASNGKDVIDATQGNKKIQTRVIGERWHGLKSAHNRYKYVGE